MTRQVDEVVRPRGASSGAAGTDVEGRAARTIRGTQLEGAVGRGGVISDRADVAPARADVERTNVEGIQAGTKVNDVIRSRVGGIA